MGIDKIMGSTATNILQLAADFIKPFELDLKYFKNGFHFAFWDYKQYTIGYGSKAKSKDEKITEAEAIKRLQLELIKPYEYVKNLPITDMQKVALISFAYNLGIDDLVNIVKRIKAKKTNKEIADAINLYTKAGGKVLTGLVNRRLKEAAQFA